MELCNRGGAIAIALAFIALAATAASAAQDETIAPITQPAHQQEVSRVGRELLARHLARTARLVLSGNAVTVGSLERATMLIEEAVKLDPDNVEIWRQANELAALAERSELRTRAIARITELDPRDTVARLQRIIFALDRYQTFDERRDAFTRLVKRGTAGGIDPAIASRLWLDLALLEQRQGNLEAFVEALTQATTLDASNREAAAIAAGFFRTRVDDVYAEAELLINLLLADPTDLTTQTALASLLINAGAYRGAARFYTLVVNNHEALRRFASHNLIADQAIALWASGAPDAALRVIADRQQLLNEFVRNARWQENPELGPMERAEIRGVLAPTLATARAAILSQTDDPNSSQAVEQALKSYDEVLAPGEQDEPLNDADRAELLLEKAWIAAWLGRNASLIDVLVQEAASLQPLNDQARRRFDGFIALREGDPAQAVELLKPLAATDIAAEIGLAEAYQKLGRRREAGELLLSAARKSPGSLIGIYAAQKLTDMLGERAPISQTAGRLERLVAGIPSIFDRYPAMPTFAVGFRVTPIAYQFGPSDPLLINIEIQNNTATPLAIDPSGPIRPEVVLQFSATLGQVVLEGNLPPAVVNLGRRIRLEPKERLIVTIDLRDYLIGQLLEANAMRGMFLRVKGIFNPTALPNGKILPALLGSESQTTAIRIEGFRLRMEWLDEMTQKIRTMDEAEDLTRMALLSQVIGARLGSEATVDQQAQLGQARAVFIQTFATLDPLAQAWLISIIPPQLFLDQLRAIAQESDDRHVRLMYLLYQLSGPDDPMIDAASRSGDPVFTALAENIVAIVEQMRRQSGGGGGMGAGRPSSGGAGGR